MAGHLHLDWQHSAADFEQRYRTERDPQLIPRWHALWLLRQGRRSVDVAAIVGRAASTIWVWVGWYRDGGLAAVAGHPRGYGSPPEPLTPSQQVALREAALTGQFASQLDAREWLVAQGFPALSRGQMARQFQLLHLRRKVPRPRSTKADPVAQAAFKKGLTDLIRAENLPPTPAIVFADELRLGLHGQVRRRWVPRGVQLVQPVEISYVWRYLVLAVAPTGRLWWTWQPRFRKEPIAETVTEWRDAGVAAIVWDNAPPHKAKLVRAVGVPLLPLPSYAPELNPAERAFEEVRRTVEGRIYGTIERKVDAVNAFLDRLATDPERVRRLAGWAWITTAISAASSV